MVTDKNKNGVVRGWSRSSLIALALLRLQAVLVPGFPSGLVRHPLSLLFPMSAGIMNNFRDDAKTKSQNRRESQKIPGQHENEKRKNQGNWKNFCVTVLNSGTQ